MPPWNLTKEQRDIDLWSLPVANPPSGCKHTKVVPSARALEVTCCQVSSSVISTLGEKHIRVVKDDSQ